MNEETQQKLTLRGVRALIAREFGISQQAVDQWVQKGSVPAERVLGVEKLTGISRHTLRPDLYPMEKA